MQYRTLAAALVMATSLSACLGGGGGDSRFRGLESVHQPVVTQGHYTLDVPAQSGDLDPGAARQVGEWLTAMGVAYGDRVSVDDSAAGGAPAARTAVHEMLTRNGLLLEDTAPITPGAIAPGYVRVIVTRARAEVPGCPDWHTRSASGGTAQTTSNYGCATNANLAAMVADPMDLVRGQSQRGNDPATASRAIRAYRTAPPTGAGGLPGGGGGAPAAPAAPAGGGQ